MSVYTDNGDLTQIACNDDFYDSQSAVVVHLSAGETYYFMVGAYGACCSDPGGNMQFHISEYIPANVDISVDSSVKINNAGTRATVNVAALCSAGSGQLDVSLSVYLEQQQGKGRLKGNQLIQGIRYSDFSCDGNVNTSVVVAPYNGIFKPGPVTISIETDYYDPDFHELAPQTIKGRIKFNTP